ncbi:RNA polymerase I specific transcription initiation factor RRN3 family protein [Klebsormidium nitens]|uniref:RNA polymerase I specific transcription initiation factor RRN3 family protein n=1 Tax=Klebsormidium nitens TaxID=105231 RepID=A0A1Y1IJA6_KLENI|nr:RNA polymerase I specific transcription initiation factor RRN3 family protein [Klebsormidium nitens]|eukprot:GAQ88796.1 RNA polymerase I specific transcription initiation factor RRN3 family protein [Klebsormidium nitens]
MAMEMPPASGTILPLQAGSKLLRQWILTALSERLKGPSTQYNQLIGEAEKIREDVAVLKVLSQSVSHLDERAHEALLLKVFGGSLWISADEANAALLDFAINLASANTAGCLPLCLDMLVRNFLPPALQPGARVTSDVLEAQVARKEAVLGAVHKTLERLMDLVPIATSRLQPIVLRRMPHKRLDREVQGNYMESMFRLADGKKGDLLRDKLLTAVVDHLIEVDVEIKWEDILEKEREADSDDEDDLHFDVDLDEHGDDAMRKEHPPARTKEPPPLDETADKMDALMCLTFEHLQRQAAHGRLDETFETLLHSFQTTILHTYRSKFTQFLLFYLCSLDPPRLSAAFADLLVATVAAPSNSYKTRMAGAAYLASFLARADYVPLSVVSSSLRRLSDWAVSYVRMLASSRVGDLLMANPDSLPPGAGVHGVFYSACQAIFYILCYRMEALSKDPVLSKALQQMPLREIVHHALNPMKVCLPAVVKEFCAQAAAFDLLDCSDVLQRNERSEGRPGAVRHNKLDMFFPFDPYLLPASLKFVEQHYNEWKPRGAPQDEDEEEEDDDEGFQETCSSERGDHGDAERSDEEEYTHMGAKSMDVGRTPDSNAATKMTEGVKASGTGLVWGSYSSGGQSDIAMSQGCTPMLYTQMSSLKQLPAILDTGLEYAKAR